MFKSLDFVSWFGTSVVRNPDKTPRVVYHGTSAEFSVFDYAKIGSHGRSEGPGFYFSTDRDIASTYGTPMEVYLSISKPIVYSRRPFAPAILRRFLKSLAIIESVQNQEPIEDGYLSNFIDVRRTSHLLQAINHVVKSLEGYKALDQIGDLVGCGVPVEFIHRALYETTGYDGYVSRGFSDCRVNHDLIYVAFFPHQIKSATKNLGTFKMSDPDIYH